MPLREGRLPRSQLSTGKSPCSGVWSRGDCPKNRQGGKFSWGCGHRRHPTPNEHGGLRLGRVQNDDAQPQLRDHLEYIEPIAHRGLRPGHISEDGVRTHLERALETSRELTGEAGLVFLPSFLLRVRILLPHLCLAPPILWSLPDPYSDSTKVAGKPNFSGPKLRDKPIFMTLMDTSSSAGALRPHGATRAVIPGGRLLSNGFPTTGRTDPRRPSLGVRSPRRLLKQAARENNRTAKTARRA